MAVYVVTWNLNKEKANYNAARTAFIAQIETYENCSDGELESVRFISTQRQPAEISDYLRLKMDDNDRLLVSRMNVGQHAGWLAKDTWNWISARL